MMMAVRRLGLVLAVHPASKGFGWALFEGPQQPVIWGNASAKFKRNATSMKRFSSLLAHYQPSVLVLEQFDADTSHHGARLRELAQTMKGFAQNRDIDVVVYPRALVGLKVAGDTKATRYAVAAAIGRRIPYFQSRLPQRRTVWKSEGERQSLFDALALGLTHFEVTRPAVDPEQVVSRRKS